MYMIVVLHVLGQGGILEQVAYGTGQFACAWLLEIAAYCAVNCYALISGYVGVRMRFRYSGILNLWMQVVFTGVVVACVMQGVMPDRVPSFAWKQGIIPVSNNNYWYYTAYFAMSFFIPFLNALLKHIPKKELTYALVLAFAVFSVYPTMLQADRFSHKDGYSVWWLVMLYITGGYFRLYGHENRIYRFCQRYGQFVYFAATLLIWAVYMLIGDKIIPYVFAGNLKADFLIKYSSPLMVIQACALLAWCAQWKLSQSGKRIITAIAPMTFGVYLIHCNPNIFGCVLEDAFAGLAMMNPVALSAAVLLIAVLIFAVCACMDAVRLRIFKWIRVKELCHRFFSILEMSGQKLRGEMIR